MAMDYSLLIILGYRVKKEKKMVWRGHFAKNWSRGGISLKIALEWTFRWKMAPAFHLLCYMLLYVVFIYCRLYIK